MRMSCSILTVEDPRVQVEYNSCPTCLWWPYDIGYAKSAWIYTHQKGVLQGSPPHRYPIGEVHDLRPSTVLGWNFTRCKLTDYFPILYACNVYFKEPFFVFVLTSVMQPFYCAEQTKWTKVFQLCTSFIYMGTQVYPSAIASVLWLIPIFQ